MYKNILHCKHQRSFCQPVAIPKNKESNAALKMLSFDGTVRNSRRVRLKAFTVPESIKQDLCYRRRNRRRKITRDLRYKAQGITQTVQRLAAYKHYRIQAQRWTIQMTNGNGIYNDYTAYLLVHMQHRYQLILLYTIIKPSKIMDILYHSTSAQGKRKQ